MEEESFNGLKRSKIDILTTRKLTLVSDEYIRIQGQLKDFCTPHVIRNTMVPSVCLFKLVWPSYGLCKFASSIL